MSLRLAMAHGGCALLLLATLAAARAAEPVPPAAAGAPPFAEFRPLIERSLFSSTRRPPVLADAQPENLDAKQLRDAWRLSGIVLDPQRHQLAIFSQRQGEQRRQLEEGMTLVDEWRLQRIGHDRVVLDSGSAQVELLLREPPAQGAGETPNAAGQPGKPASQSPPNPGTPGASAPAAK